jgi:RING finger/CHY zinc finger protein 1
MIKTHKPRIRVLTLLPRPRPVQIRAISVMRCGHTIHEHCFQQLFAHHQYTCPTCSKSVCDMAAVWRRRDEDVAATPMPPEYAAVAVPILCNDCGGRSAVPFHVLGLKCTPCGSYNTRR